MTLRNEKDVLQLLHGEGLIDYTMPLWLNFSHSDKRKFIPNQEFNNQLSELASGLYYVPKQADAPIPVSEVVLPVLYDAQLPPIDVSFVVTVRPLSENEFRGVSRNPDFDAWMERFSGRKRTGASSEVDVQRLEQKALEMKNADVFQPHVIGVAEYMNDTSVFLFPFDSLHEKKESLIGIVNDSLMNEDFDGFFARDSNINIKNRMKYGLDNFIEGGYVHAQPKIAQMMSGPRYDKVKNIVFDALVTKRFNAAPMKKVHYTDLVKAVKEGVDESLVSYYPLTISEFGKDFLGESSVQTFPVFLSNHNPYSGEKGLFNFGLLEKYAQRKDSLRDHPDVAPSVSVAFWANKNFANHTSCLIRDYLNVAVTPVYTKSRSGKPIFLETKEVMKGF